MKKISKETLKNPGKPPRHACECALKKQLVQRTPDRMFKREAWLPMIIISQLRVVAPGIFGLRHADLAYTLAQFRERMIRAIPWRRNEQLTIARQRCLS
jgi:hypothetical protein